MYDQSFCRKTLEKMLQKGDFTGIPAASHATYREEKAAKAVIAAASAFATSSPMLKSFPLKGKAVYGFVTLEDELVSRKLSANLARVIRSQMMGRTQIVSSLRLLLEEGIPFRIYRLDVRSFYESFQYLDIVNKVSDLDRLSPQSKILISSILQRHSAIGGNGVPRGLSMSASLSDLMMRDFDLGTRRINDVYFYARYVDDIIAITSRRENPKAFLSSLVDLLPNGLELNPKKRQIVEARGKVAPIKQNSAPVEILQFDYLGYSFLAREPIRMPDKQPGTHQRAVCVDIAATKIRKIKTRIARAFLDYSKNSDWLLLRDRVKFLTQNFSVYNAKAGGKKLAGIYHSYPLVSNDAVGLAELDRYLRNAILTKNGTIFSVTSALLSANMRRALLSHSFVRGHAQKTFVYFSAVRISEIQKCWKY